MIIAQKADFLYSSPEKHYLQNSPDFRLSLHYLILKSSEVYKKHKDMKKNSHRIV